MYTLAWTCLNPLIMAYFFVMAMCMAFMTGFYETDEEGATSSDRDGDDDG